MRELIQWLNVEGEWVMERLINAPFDSADRNYYQGRLDQVAAIRGYLAGRGEDIKQILIERG